ncbi:hypothetical protein OsJ_03469 [Oryza sativa Japonica Group]|uniref:DUF7595 domain-containing protein n=1 Tax=Oryza sativa subsp. japonica TaxID=39947 RepID=B9EZP5_ORYSJ|nr:hypothetical protein OsJ_03469 [Oryza sativa Japonica Group]
MPPLRQGRARAAAAARPSPYRGGWLSRRCRSSGADTAEYDANGTSLTDDALAATFTRLPNAADVVRCAATCRRWASVVAKEANALSRALPLLPGRALGFFHKEQDAAAVATTRKRKRRAIIVDYSTPPCFVPTAFGSRLLGYNLPSASALPLGVQTDALGLLDLSLSRPVASRNGRLVLELQSEEHVNDGKLNLCVCNPMTGDVAVLPPLSGKDRPRMYACTLLTDADIDQPPPSANFFRVLIVYNRDRFTAFRSYSSDTGSWSMEAKKTPGPKLTNWDLGKLGHGIVLHAVAYWPLRRTTLAVRMPLDGIISTIQQFRLLGVTPERKLCFIDAANSSGYVGLASMVFETTGDDMCGGAGEWVRKGGIGQLRRQFKIKSADASKLRWFCEKSCTLLFTLGKGSSPWTFALNLGTKKIEKLTTGVDCNWWRNFVGYEMDAAAYLMSIARR